MTKEDLIYVMLYMTKFYVFLVVFYWCFYILFNAAPISAGVLDSPEWFASRSGVKLHIDQYTGCHYLIDRDGKINPRWNSEGKQFGCNQ